MLHQHRDVVASIAREAARSGQSLDEALAANVMKLAPLLDDGVTALEIVAAAEEDVADMERWRASEQRRWIEDYRRSKVAV